MHIDEDRNYEPEFDPEDFDTVEIPMDESLVVLEGPEKTVNICGIEFFYREGFWCEKDDDGNYMPDWDLTWFYTDDEEPADYVYFEQDSPEVAIYNLTQLLGGRPDDVETIKNKIRAK
ncbi:MAG: hypothetical protein K5894_07565 [Lachnospiraceae bacterium]|nr:hypothetical protein [Lachnospiraceae bacterium]